MPNRSREESRLRYVESLVHIKKNIECFNAAIKQQDSRFLKPVAHFRNWYYLHELDMFGPGKFIGFKDMDTDRYFRDPHLSNERCGHYLSPWFDKSDDIDLELKLIAQLGQYYKINKEVMIFNLKEQYRHEEPILLAEEVTEQPLHEGARKQIYVNSYERNQEARKKCIDHYGPSCQACKLNFEDLYGDIGKDFIHIHHLIPLHELGEDYTVDPINHLRPVCPNCHAMLHRKNPVITIEHLREIIDARLRPNRKGGLDDQ